MNNYFWEFWEPFIKQSLLNFLFIFVNVGCLCLKYFLYYYFCNLIILYYYFLFIPLFWSSSKGEYSTAANFFAMYFRTLPISSRFGIPHTLRRIVERAWDVGFPWAGWASCMRPDCLLPVWLGLLVASDDHAPPGLDRSIVSKSSKCKLMRCCWVDNFSYFDYTWVFLSLLFSTICFS